MSTTETTGIGLDIILVQEQKTGGIAKVKAKLQDIIVAVDTRLIPKATHISFNWKNPIINDEIAPIVTMRLGTIQYNETVYGRKLSSTKTGHLITIPFSLHVWNEKLNYELQDGVDESIPTTELAEKIIDALESFPNDGGNSGICYFHNITSRESEPERGPKNMNRVIIEGFMIVKRVIYTS